MYVLAPEICVQAERLREAYEASIPVQAQAAADETAAESAVTAAEAALEATEQAISASSETLGSARREKYDAHEKVSDVEAAVLGARSKVRRLGGTGAGTGELNPPPAPAEGEAGTSEAHAVDVLGSADLKMLTARELDEVRKMTRPPQVVRRALELVQILLQIAEGVREEVAFRPDGEEAPWEELQNMIAKADFVKRVASLQPLPLSKRPELLQRTARKWPGLLEAVGKDASAGREGWKALKRAARNGASSRNLHRLAAVKDGSAATPQDVGDPEAATTADASAPGPSKVVVAGGGLGGVGATKLAMAIAAAQEAAKLDGGQLTVEAVEYASRPCGAIFRHIATVLQHAVKMAAERAAAQRELDAKLLELQGLAGALSASMAFNQKLADDELRMTDERELAAEGLETAKAALRAAMLAHIRARETTEELQKAAALAAQKARQAGEAEKRRMEAAERRRRDKLESERLAQDAIERDLATRPKEPVNKRLAWLHAHSLSTVKPLEFGPDSSVLPSDAPITLARVAKELQMAPSLKLHIAGHVDGAEDPKLSSQRAQSVGAALIALGAVPSRLRAKGYGATISLTAAMRQRLKIKTERRVGIHAISEVGTRYPLEFAIRDDAITDKAAELLADVAKLLTEHETLRLSIEGHTDDRGEPNDNGKLSVRRAQSVLRHLESIGIDSKRLVAHGFGSTLPLEENGTDEGRARNRRVQFLVIPDVSEQQVPVQAPAPAAEKQTKRA